MLKTLIRPGEYHDSVTLMAAARALSDLAGVRDAAVVMATEVNHGVLKEAGLLTPEAAAATPNDVVIVVRAESDRAAEAALAEALRLLAHKPAEATGGEGAARPHSLRGAMQAAPGANVAIVSVAGRYAADEAWEALRRGLHVLLFSDHVSLEDEVALKRYACERGLLLMGPGAGTAILNGVALGFANVLPRGPVGLAAAAGTGLQEVSTLLARLGVGVSQGLGTGGRDLSVEVGGLMMLEGLKALQADPATRVIGLISKPPAPVVAARILAQAGVGAKPTVVCFLGLSDPASLGDLPENVTLTPTLLAAARVLAAAAGAEVDLQARAERKLQQQAQRLRASLAPGQRQLRGLFSGGTLCYEAQLIWRKMDLPVRSNAPLAADYPTRRTGHTAIDLGEEEFTVGRPHPMIDNDLRRRYILKEARDRRVAVILLDVVLGYGAHPDPAAELGPAIREAQSLARAAGRRLAVVASVTGTDQDPQVRSTQAARLKQAGAVICDSNAEAAMLAGLMVKG
jgi:succinyl-CoA synthetase alpha subunit